MNRFDLFILCIALLYGCGKSHHLELSDDASSYAQIRFSVSREDTEVQTRTLYSDQIVDGRERVDWSVGFDRIRIICDQAIVRNAQNQHYGDYKIKALSSTNSSGDTKSSAGMFADGDTLCWGGKDDHYFYAVYPAPTMISEHNVSVSSSDISLVQNDARSVVLRGTIPSSQQVFRVGNTRRFLPNMNYAYMYGMAKAKPSNGDIRFRMSPLWTAFRLTLLADSEDFILSELRSIRLTSENTPPAGVFTATLKEDGKSVSFSAQKPYIEISLPAGVSLSSTEPLDVTFMALPKDLSQLTVTLYFASGKTRKLKLTSSDLVSAGNPDGWVTIPASKKMILSSMSVTDATWTPTFSVTPASGINADCFTSTSMLRIASYASSGSAREPLGWKASFSSDGGLTWSNTAPEWLSGLPSSDADMPSSSSKQYTLTFSRNRLPRKWEGSIAEVASTRANAIDLSYRDIYGTVTTRRNTANCYVVSQPGWYKIPMVYGNAIKGGSTNSRAYTATNTSTFTNGSFHNHADAAIRSPWIKNNSVTINGAALLYQDARSLLRNVSFQNDYIYFYVSPETIQQGNAVVAAKSGSTIVWSWHIWVMDKPAEHLRTYNLYQLSSYPSIKNPNAILALPIGAKKPTDNREVKVRLVQDKTGNTVLFSIIHRGTVYHSAPYFQFGRKDPLLPTLYAEGNNTSAAQFFDGNGNVLSNVQTTYNSGGATIGYAIQHPTTYLRQGAATGRLYAWCNPSYYNMWNASQGRNSNDAAVSKTIYDPSPAGFKLANRNAFFGLVKAISSSTALSMEAPIDNYNSPDADPDNADIYGGYHFYTKQGSGDRFLLPFLGMLGWSIPLQNYFNTWTSCGYYSNSSGGDFSNGTAFAVELNYYDKIRFLPQHFMFYGFPVLPVSE